MVHLPRTPPPSRATRTPAKSAFPTELEVWFPALFVAQWVTNQSAGGNRERGARGGDRGGRGAGREGSGRANRDDRHSKTGVQYVLTPVTMTVLYCVPLTISRSEHQKQVDRSWGANTGEGEFNDETNGLADARKEEDAEGIVATDATAVDAPEPEEDKTVSYEQYLAEQAAKREQFALAPAARAANEGSNVNIPEGKAISRDDEEEELIPAKHKQPRERHRTQTHKYETLDVNLAWVEPAQSSAGGRGGDRPERGGRGGRGGFRGDRADREGGARGSGESRGGRGDGARGGERRGGRGRGDGPPRGAPRGDGASRAPRGGRGAAPNVTDNAAFPALG